ncbi:MAG: hypothetical protein COB02_15050 [Candidatus Cloacimonadota bacterium]|nr:MAG: hypothetical protein COB02_15050 [Candidatus Cloacimonadota bacterium]
MIGSLKKLSILLLVAFSFLGNSFALSEQDQQIISKFWKLEKQSTKIMAKIADWAQIYNFNEGVISAVSSIELKALVKEFYQLAVYARKIKKEIAGTNNRLLMDQKFKGLIEQGDLSDADLLKLVIGTATNLVEFEQMSFFYHLASEDTTLVTKLNEIRVYGLKNHFDRLEKSFLGVHSRSNFALSMQVLDENSDRLKILKSGKKEYFFGLMSRLDTNFADELKKEKGFFNTIKNFFKKDFARAYTNHKKRLGSYTYYLSKFFGNASGALNIQKYIDSISKDELKRVRLEELQPGDVVLEKTSGAITDKFIPGHFGHVAMYFGRPDQLQDVMLSNGKRLLDHPRVIEYMDRLENGETIVESIRPGVTLVKLEHWRVNDVAILRPTTYPKEKLGDTLLQAIRYVGTAYDFNFDVNTREIIVCSELPFQAFEDINFRIAKAAGRWTISPDDVAVLAGPMGQRTLNRPFELTYFNNNLRVVPKDEMFDLYVKLLAAEKSRYNEVPEQSASFLMVK